MLGDYLRSFWRGVLHNKVATLINVGGLVLGLAVFFALSFYVDREFSWDEHWEDADRIYTPSGLTETPTGTTTSPSNFTPYVMGTTLQTLRPDAFETYVRVYSAFGTITINDDDEPVNQSVDYAEPALLDLIQLETLEGSLQEAFADPRSIAINERAAERFFPGESPLGRTINFTAQQDTLKQFVIRAVYRVPEPSTFAGFPFFALLDATAPPVRNARLDLWQFQPPPPPTTPPQPGSPPLQAQQPFYVGHYFKLREGVDVKSVEADLRAFMDEGRQMDTGNSTTRFVFRNLQETHLQPNPFEPGDNVQRLSVYAAIGVLVLLISGCNFVMLATLRLVDRMREVGIRKTVGGGAGQLMLQYLLDAFFHTLLAAALAVAFLAFAFPKLQTMLELPLQLDLLTVRNLSLCISMVVVFTFVSSVYPAWLTSQGKPGPLLRNGAGAVVGTGTALRKVLVGLQFAIVVVLLLATAVVRQQIEYTRTRDRGFSLENVIAMRSTVPDAFGKMPAILAEFNKVPGVVKAAVGGIAPGMVMISTGNLVKHTAPDGSVREAALQAAGVGPGYFDAMSVRVLAGREYTEEDAPPPSTPGAPPDPNAPPRIGRVILNEASVRALGFATPEAALDQLLDTELSGFDRQIRKQSFRVIGVVADTQFSSAMLPPIAQYYNFTTGNNFLAVKVAPGEDRSVVTEALKTAWDGIVTGGPFTPTPADALTGFQLRREEFEARIVTGSTVLAIVIALLGLYGLVAATVTKRTKEIGVRKVMGAERKTIVTLFLWQFSKPIVVANVLAWPLGFWGITQWMQRFPYQLDMAVIVFSGVAASLIAVLIAWLTVGVMAARASSVKPVLALRYE